MNKFTATNKWYELAAEGDSDVQTISAGLDSINILIVNGGSQIINVGMEKFGTEKF